MNEAPAVVTAFLDASVLYPALLRNLLMYFGAADLYAPRWSARVHQEWITALRRNRPDLLPAQIERTRQLMDAHITDALIEGYEHHIAVITLPDADDRHVFAAAIEGQAEMIVTANLRDFPAEALAPFGITAVHPDHFLAGLVMQQADLASAVFLRLCGDYKHPPQSPQQVIGAMKRQGLVATATALSELL